MELVYLWVEEYKNIKNQGFNFSPRFTCKYEDGELTIDKKEHVSIFPENINITAIVGENGSGKSSIIHNIFKLIFLNYSGEELKDDEFFLIIQENNEFKKISTNKKYINMNIKNITKIDFYNLYINYTFDIFSYEKWVDNLYHKSDHYKTPILIEPNNNINLNNLNYLTIRKIKYFYTVLSDSRIINTYFNPKTVQIHYASDNSIKFFIFSKIQRYKIIEKYKSVCQSFFEEDRSDKFMRGSYFNTIESKLTAYYKDNKIKELNDSYIIIKILSLDENRINKQLYLDLKNKLENIYISHDSFESLLQLFNDSKSTLDLNKLRAYDTLKIFDAIHFNELLAKDEDLIINAITKNENIIIKNYRDIIKYLPSWLDIEFFDDNKSFNNLSTGEKTFFRLQISLLYQISNLKDTLYNTINIFLDEIELTLHPLWQKKILQELIFSISKINTKKINLFFITHSPFILSDVPKENVIFLEKGKQVYPNIETFGANIHTLLSHGFFMKDGLMGEFAKGKIEDVINYLNDKESTIKDNDEAQKLLNIIGEPVIKNQLQRILDSKRLSKVDEIDKIKSDIKNLAKRLEELEK